MTWEDSKQEAVYKNPNNIVDVAFKIDAPLLPLDHGYALARAIDAVLPWFSAESQSALHLIYGAASGNGWDRPQGADAILNLSRRTRLSLRIPETRQTDIKALIGQQLDIAGYPVKIGQMSIKKLQICEVLFARFVATDVDISEADFLKSCLHEVKAMGIRCQKAMSGRSYTTQQNQQQQFSRSLMLADLSPEESVILQEQGLGCLQKHGFGVFIPHKGIASIA